MYRVKVHKLAAKYYLKLDSKNKRKINKAITEIMNNPFDANKTKSLKGRLKDKYRYAIGNLRIIYSVDEKEKTIYIEAISQEETFINRELLRNSIFILMETQGDIS